MRLKIALTNVDVCVGAMHRGPKPQKTSGPLQPAKYDPASGVAVNVTTVS